MGSKDKTGNNNRIQDRGRIEDYGSPRTDADKVRTARASDRTKQAEHAYKGYGDNVDEGEIRRFYYIF